jgi:predicted DNA-binding helix-hairpin-helix protein
MGKMRGSVKDIDSKVALLMGYAGDDREGAPETAQSPGRSAELPPRLRNATGNGVGALRPINIRSVAGPGRRQVRLLRILMTNACSFNCHYCPMRRDRELPRALLKPHEIVRIFFEARRRDWCEGLFLTTAIPGRPGRVMDMLIEVLELLRVKYRFGGYVHVKIVPGGDMAQVERLSALASRVSINLETACGQYLPTIAPEKTMASAVASLEKASAMVRESRFFERDGRPLDALKPGSHTGMTTQFVVGATPESDREILTVARSLYRKGAVHHAHFAAFRPIVDTPMENAPETPALREHRLYQVDHLMRDYHFGLDEIAFEGNGNLSLELDPKTAWALAHPERYPVEIRTASREELLRVPGIGPTSSRAIVERRRSTLIRDLADLRKLGVVAKRAAGFVTIAGRRLADVRFAEQLGFWKADDQAGVPKRTYGFSPGTFR